MQQASRWYGFNLPELFLERDDPRWRDMTLDPRGKFVEDHFRWIADWGFTFVRLPMTYKWWVRDGDPHQLDEEKFAPIDQAVEWAVRYGLHISLNMHHAPGYCINPPIVPEPFRLWTDQAALDCFHLHWQAFARRYRHIGPETLSFNLINEPTDCIRMDYIRVMRTTAEKILEIDPDRTIVIDGYDVGQYPCIEFTGEPFVQGCRGYWPRELSHYAAWWAHMPIQPPTWPGVFSEGKARTREELRAYFEPWFVWQRSGGSVLCGEFGGYNQTPRPVFMAWMHDLLEIFREASFGWALWNFRGSFGILDSGRSDTAYVDWYGHQLDQELLQALQQARA